MNSLTMATWNVRSLVETSGDRCIRGKRGGSNNVDRKLDLVVSELKRYGVSIAAIQETKWFGSDIWQADDYTFLHSGRPLPNNGESAMRNEGVGIALNKEATKAWKEAGEVWDAVNSRIITARLRLTKKGRKVRGMPRETSNKFATIISVYAPTAKATPDTKQRFLNALQDTLDKTAPSDILLLLGDLNARVGSLGADEDHWRGTLGKHGVGERNQAGEDLLEFCTVNQLSIMNTWFEKKRYHLETWTHPGTKRSHMIDYVIMRSSQRVLCTDVQVMRGANCWTDHQMIRVRIRMTYPHYRTNRRSGHVPIAVSHLHQSAYRAAYQDCISTELEANQHLDSNSVEQNWDRLKTSIVTAAESSLGRSRKRQPEWFQEKADILSPLIEAKNIARNKMLADNSRAKRQCFRRHQRKVKEAVDTAKEDWIHKVAQDAEDAVKDGQTRWDSIRKLQLTHAGRRPAMPRVVLKECGQLTQNPDEVIARWHDHFTKILNIKSVYREEMIMDMVQKPTQWAFNEPPTWEELELSLSRLKKGKAAGGTEITSEMILAAPGELRGRMLTLMKQIWMEGTVVKDWKDAEIVPIPKKGDLRECDNWRGISLLDVVGKVFARIVQDRLQQIAEGILPDSQCGFRKGRGCTDMIFAARQLVEKTLEHNDSLFVLFVDLKKAYDSVPRSAVWSVLSKYGVPPAMLNIIKSFHEGMEATVRIGSMTSGGIQVHNGLRQGCTLAPSLFNVYFCAMVTNWRDSCPQAGVPVLYKHGRKLVSDRTAKARHTVPLSQNPCLLMMLLCMPPSEAHLNTAPRCLLL